MAQQPKTKVPTTDEAGQIDTTRDHDDLLNGGSGLTDSPVDPPNQGADPDADGDLLHGGSGEPG